MPLKARPTPPRNRKGCREPRRSRAIHFHQSALHWPIILHFRRTPYVRNACASTIVHRSISSTFSCTFSKARIVGVLATIDNQVNQRAQQINLPKKHLPHTSQRHSVSD